jgi:hypothetical protein
MPILEESVHSYVFRGTLTNGVLSISSTQGENQGVVGTGITNNSLAGMAMLSRMGFLGLIASNSVWYSGGMTVRLRDRATTIGGYIDVFFVYPHLGRFHINNVSVNMFAMPLTSVLFKTQVTMAAQYREAFESESQVVMRSNRYDAPLSYKTFVKVRTGVHREM